MPLETTRIFPSAENPLDLVLKLSEKLRFSEPCPLSPSDGFPTGMLLAPATKDVFKQDFYPLSRLAYRYILGAK